MSKKTKYDNLAMLRREFPYESGPNIEQLMKECNHDMDEAREILTHKHQNKYAAVRRAENQIQDTLEKIQMEGKAHLGDTDNPDYLLAKQLENMRITQSSFKRTPKAKSDNYQDYDDDVKSPFLRTKAKKNCCTIL